jgi:hypothetical protein
MLPRKTGPQPARGGPQEEGLTTEDTKGTEEERRERNPSVYNSTVKRSLGDLIGYSSSPSVSSMSSVVSLFLILRAASSVVSLFRLYVLRLVSAIELAPARRRGTMAKRAQRDAAALPFLEEPR